MNPTASTTIDLRSTGLAHLARTRAALDRLQDQLPVIEAWAAELAAILPLGGRVLVAGNGGSAAQAQHLTAELVGRYHHERAPFSAVALTADSATTTAIANDYGVEELFARQVLAHGRAGDVLLVLSTSGRSPNVLRAVEAASRSGLRAWALTGARPNPLAAASHSAVSADSDHTATVQEVHQVAIHLLCSAFDEKLGIEP